MYFSIKNVKPISDYQLILTFENEQTRIFDMKPYLEFGVFKELANTSIFNSVKVHFDTIEWPNEIDLDPEFLFEKSTPFNV